MYLLTNNKEECSGCSACQAACPRQCIEMKADEEGFRYPVIHREQCISCRMCEKVCPIGHQAPKPAEPKCYYGWLRDRDDRFRSTSGGAFSAIANALLAHGVRHVYGAAYDTDLTVRHTGITDPKDLCRLRRSKYVQSDMGTVFRDIAEQLRQGEKVLFSGTPCQVQGLLNTLNSRLRENLYTISLICHGVSSPMVFRRYLDEVARSEGSPVSSVTFRDKQTIRGKLTHKCTTISLSNGRELKSSEDPYTLAFGMGLITRPSCFTCPYTTPCREADVSIGDFWGIDTVLPQLRPQVSEGISLLLSHSGKGDEMIDMIRSVFCLETAELKWAINPRQQQLMHPMKKHPGRDRFMRNMAKGHSFIGRARREIFLYKARRSIAARIGRFKRKISNGSGLS